MTNPSLASQSPVRMRLAGVLAACLLLLATLSLTACASESTTNEASTGPSDAEFVHVDPTEQEEISATVIVDSSEVDDPVSADITIDVPAGITAYDALQCTSLGIESTRTTYGEYVVSIEGLAEGQNGPTSGWTFTVNGQRPDTAASEVVLNDGDVVEWKYVKESNV